MLNWDDEPNTQTRPATQEGPAPVNVDDKRVINGETDINQLAPFKYPWAWEYFMNANKNHWTPLDVNMAQDVHDYHHRLSAPESTCMRTCWPTSPPPTSWRCATSAWR